MAGFADKKLIVGSVAAGPYTNYGNALIEQAMLDFLGLPRSTPKFSVFERINDDLLEWINSHDYLLVTGCTTLQDDPGHQRCFDQQFQKIRIPKVCFGGTFYCEPDDRPSLRIPQLYDLPIGVRDPWAANYLRGNGIDCELIGCPTLINKPNLDTWQGDDAGDVLISSTPPVSLAEIELRGRRQRYIAHDADSPGERLLTAGIFDGASLVITGRLHAALPAIAKGIRVRFYDQRYVDPNWRSQYCGSIRYSLLEFLGIPLDGGESPVYPSTQIKVLKRNCQAWMQRVFAVKKKPAIDA